MKKSLFLASLIAAPVFGAAPVVIWHSDDVRGGESVMLAGEGFEPGTTGVRGIRCSDDRVELPRDLKASPQPPSGSEELTLLQASDHSMIALLPAQWARGEYALWVGHGTEWSSPTILNRANPEWVSNSHVQAGEEIRVVGRNLTVEGTTPSVSLCLPSGAYRILPTLAAEKYAVRVSIPADLPTGDYRLRLHNGFGGAEGWGDSIGFSVSNRIPWPDKRFDVKVAGARGDGKTDDTASVQRAIGQAGENGGGIVYFPPGVYRVSKMLRMPERTVLKGAGQEEVTVFWPKFQAGDPEPDPAVIVGERNFGLEDLTLVFQIQQHGILAPFEPSLAKKNNPLSAIDGDRLGQSGGVFVNRCTIRHLRFSPRIVKGDRRMDIPVGASGGVTLGLAGPGIKVTDNDIVSWGCPLMLMNIRESLISGNSLGNGRNGWYCLTGAQATIFENNRIAGRDLESTGGSMNRDFPARLPLTHLYVAHNHYSDMYGGEREALTFDNTSPGNRRWLGRVESADGVNAVMAGPGWGDNGMSGLQCLIVAGRGLGQYRTIVASQGTQVTFDRPWLVTPDKSSVADLIFLPREVIVYDNDFRDSSVSVQLYGSSYDFVVDHNVSTRAGGFWGYATYYAPIPKYQQRIWNHLAPMYFAQFLNNTVNDGYVYHQGPATDGADIGGMIGLAANPWNPEGMPVAVGYGLVIRGNTLLNHASIVVRTGFLQTDKPASPVIHAALIEGNSISRAPVGIQVGPGVDGAVTRNNPCDQVETPVVND